MKDKPSEQPMLLYPKQAQDYLGVGPTKFYELSKEPNFPKPVNLLNKRPMYKRSDLDEWVNSLTH